MFEQSAAFKGCRMYDDIPVENAKYFNFDAYTDALSEIILNKENRTPFTIAINGKWGSGKTTLMRSLRRKLEKGPYLFSWDFIPENGPEGLKEFLIQNFHIDWVKTAKFEKIDDDKAIRVYNEKNSLSLRLDDEKTRVKLEIDDGTIGEFIAKRENGKLNINKNQRKVKSVWFDAWKYSETDSMLAALIFEIFEEMGRNKKGKEIKEGLVDKINAKLIGGKNINLLQEVSDLAKILTMGQVEIEKWFEEPAYKKNLCFYDVFQDYMKKILLTFVLDEKDGEFNDDKGVLVIFIDDLDRCSPRNITKVLESINLFLNQKGCFFVIGTDISIISHAITTEYEGLVEAGFSGRDYIKKMVQLQFDLPAIRENDIEEFIRKLGIEEALETYLKIIIKGLENNQRETKRYLNSLNLMRMLSRSIKELKIKEELLIKWSILNFSFESFMEDVNSNYSLLYDMQEISRMEDKEKINKYREEFLDGDYKTLLNKYISNKRIIDVLKEGNELFEDIEDYIYLSSIAPKDPELKPELKSLKRTIEDYVLEPGANLIKANLEGARIRNSNLQKANLEGANLRDTHMEEANLEGANLRGADLIGTYLTGAYLNGADFTTARFNERCLKTILRSHDWPLAKFDKNIWKQLESMVQAPLGLRDKEKNQKL